MEQAQNQLEKAVQVAQMYYYQNLPMKRIAAELQVSHSTISRLLTWARNEGLIEIKINDIRGRSSPFEEMLKLRYRLREVKIVSVAEVAGENVWQDRVARMAANHLNLLMESDLVLGVVVGQMINQMAAYLTPKPLVNAQVVQMNGGEYIDEASRIFSGFLVAKIASNYEAREHLLSLPAAFDRAETKRMVWAESYVMKILQRQAAADLIIFSPELPKPDMLTEADKGSVVGSIANLLIRENGDCEGISRNAHSCGPDLSLFQKANRSICIVSGKKNLAALQATLVGQYATDLIIDEPTARQLMATFSENPF